eukprot:gnl/Dysnectes_brevis/2128_a2473_1067.p1 GENE.gnl/Dysnectes_brevis/2128_a2473_1067~~gnl/Dysnectes_brevis/2128_a2473_1067.p1  ORF type:complete len:674 (-),score=46.27 gnl/Dysnectes_brevis/2128_a2473_1067:172-2193(-)
MDSFTARPMELVPLNPVDEETLALFEPSDSLTDSGIESEIQDIDRSKPHTETRIRAPRSPLCSTLWHLAIIFILTSICSTGLILFNEHYCLFEAPVHIVRLRNMTSTPYTPDEDEPSTWDYMPYTLAMEIYNTFNDNAGVVRNNDHQRDTSTSLSTLGLGAPESSYYLDAVIGNPDRKTIRSVLLPSFDFSWWFNQSYRSDEDTSSIKSAQKYQPADCALTWNRVLPSWMASSNIPLWRLNLADAARGRGSNCEHCVQDFGLQIETASRFCVSPLIVRNVSTTVIRIENAVFSGTLVPEFADAFLRNNTPIRIELVNADIGAIVLNRLTSNVTINAINSTAIIQLSDHDMTYYTKHVDPVTKDVSTRTLMVNSSANPFASTMDLNLQVTYTRPTSLSSSLFTHAHDERLYLGGVILDWRNLTSAEDYHLNMTIRAVNTPLHFSFNTSSTHDIYMNCVNTHLSGHLSLMYYRTAEGSVDASVFTYGHLVFDVIPYESYMSGKITTTNLNDLLLVPIDATLTEGHVADKRRLLVTLKYQFAYELDSSPSLDQAIFQLTYSDQLKILDNSTSHFVENSTDVITFLTSSRSLPYVQSSALKGDISIIVKFSDSFFRTEVERLANVAYCDENDYPDCEFKDLYQTGHVYRENCSISQFDTALFGYDQRGSCVFDSSIG